jgi:hypothetical protein
VFVSNMMNGEEKGCSIFFADVYNLLFL